MTKLILIDGPPGVGKTTLGASLAERLPSHRLLLEMDRDHPLHPVPVGGVAADFTAVAHMDFRELGDLLLAKWSLFLESLSSGQDGVLLESYPYQSHLRVLWQMNAPSDVLFDWLQRLHLLLRSHDPLLVMLVFSGDETRLLKVYEDRGPAWMDAIAGLASSTAYGRARGLSGHEGALSFLGDYQEVLGDWSSDWPFKVVDLEAWEFAPAEQAACVLEKSV